MPDSNYRFPEMVSTGFSAAGLSSQNTQERVNYYVMDRRTCSFHLMGSRNGRLTIAWQYRPRPARSRSHLDRCQTASGEENPVDRSELLELKFHLASTVSTVKRQTD